MDLQDINQIEKATRSRKAEILRIGAAILFIVGIIFYAAMTASAEAVSSHYLLIAAAVIGGYMALNIGANDVANNVGPAVGSKALSMGGAIVIAAIFEASGALIAGGDVVGTIRNGIIDPAMIPNSETFVWLMMAALMAGALWLNLATAVGAPVSTTHSIVGGVLGAGIAAGGLGIANWDKMGAIAASWVISPVLGGIIAAIFLYLIKRTITYQSDMMQASRRMVPLMVSLMAWAFSTYLVLKGFKHLIKFSMGQAMLIGLVVAAITFFLVRPLVGRYSGNLENNKASVNKLFTIPLIFAAALLSFAHGANDVANAVGPLAAIHDVLVTGAMAAKATIPIWVMMVGALGIAIGLALYGPKLIKTVGSEITELDQMRAFCIAMAAAITVIVATQLGLPVSSTHIAVGAVFGVGFLREHLKATYAKMIEEIKSHHEGEDKALVEEQLARFHKATLRQKAEILREIKSNYELGGITRQERKGLKKVYKTQLVKRSHVMKIVAAWVITVPASALLGALWFFTLRGMLLP